MPQQEVVHTISRSLRIFKNFRYGLEDNQCVLCKHQFGSPDEEYVVEFLVLEQNNINIFHFEYMHFKCNKEITDSMIALEMYEDINK